jgi:hypothetical protein
MKNKILTGIALLSMALITTLNVNAFDPVDGDHDENEEGGGGDTFICSSGGPGSTSCSVSFDGGGGGINGGTSCSVECSTGYYACCNAYHNKCQCRES